MIGGHYYRALTVLSRRCGLWLFRTGAWFVASGYYLFFPRRVAASADFYRTLRPGRGWWYYRACAWRQFHRFTGLFVDRFLLQSGQPLTHTSEGLEHLDAALGRGSGGVLLMSHVGNWEIAAHLLKRQRRHLPLLLFLGAREREQIEKLQKEHLVASGIRVVVTDEVAPGPYDALEGIRHLKKGGLVSLTGDMAWHSAQQTLAVRFLGRRVNLPAGPHVLAMLAGVPLFYFFSYRTGPRSHHFIVSAPKFVSPASRAQRAAALQASAQAYADCLENHVRRHPFDWFHFRPLWDNPGDA